jgi:hypothetical protein
MNEAQFNKWLVHAWFSAPKTMSQRIETSTSSGVPDIYLVHQGFSVWIESKILTPRGQALLRPYQQAWHYRHGVAGGKTLILGYDTENDVVHVWIPQKTQFKPSGPYLATTSESNYVFPRSASYQSKFLDLIQQLSLRM